MPDPQSKKIISELTPDVAELSQRKSFYCLDEQGLPLVRAILTEDPELPASLAQEFCEHLQQFPELSGGIPPNRIGRLKEGISFYLEQVMMGFYDLDAARDALRAGTLHQRIGVSPKWYLGACGFFINRLQQRILERCSLPQEVQLQLETLLKSMMLDASFVMESYFHAGHDDLEQLATHDLLTGLPNLHSLWEQINQALLEWKPGRTLAMVLLGLNRFKVINETLGYRVGDKVLKIVTQRLRGALAPEDYLFRLGGDIFGILTAGHVEPQVVLDRGKTLLRRLENPVMVHDIGLSTDACLGVAHYPDHGKDGNALVQNAEVALYSAKRLQKGIVVYSPNLKRFSPQHLTLMGELRAALDRDELTLYYQPKISLKEGRITGVEALIRWIHPSQGFMAPGLFIPIAEQTNLIHPVTRWVIEAAIKQASRWQEQGTGLSVAVNLAAPNLQNSELPEMVTKLIERYKTDPSGLSFELTESGLMADPDRALSTAERLRSLGVWLSIDDFGTGYSSLAYLKRLPVNEIKIDRTFVSSMCREPKDSQIVEATIQLGHALELEVAAEGIEDIDTLQKLRSLDCDTGQGFFLSHPLSLEQLEEFLADESSWPWTSGAAKEKTVEE